MAKDAYWVNFLTRDVLEQAQSYHEARDRLANTTILAPAYFILGGNSSGQVNASEWRRFVVLPTDYDVFPEAVPGFPSCTVWCWLLPQAAIITRSREKAEDVWDLGTRNSTWYLLETNYDNWKAPFFLDDRRTPGNKCMHKMTQKVTILHKR